MPDVGEPDAEGPDSERQQLNQLIDRLRVFASQLQEIAAGRASPDSLIGAALVLGNDLTVAANWLDSLVELEEEVADDT